MTPADVADKRGVVINDALTSDFPDGIEAFILEDRLVDFVGFRIGDQSVGWIEGICTGGTSVVVVDGGFETALQSRH